MTQGSSAAFFFFNCPQKRGPVSKKATSHTANHTIPFPLCPAASVRSVCSETGEWEQKSLFLLPCIDTLSLTQLFFH